MNPYYYFWIWLGKVWRQRAWKRFRVNKLDAFDFSQLDRRGGTRAAVEAVLRDAGYTRAVIFESFGMILVHIECEDLPSSISYVEERINAVKPAGVLVVVYPSLIHSDKEHAVEDQIMWIMKVREEENEGTYTVRPTVRAGRSGEASGKHARAKKRNRPANANRHKKAVSSGRKRVGRGRASARPSSHNNRRGKNASDRP